MTYDWRSYLRRGDVVHSQLAPISSLICDLLRWSFELWKYFWDSTTSAAKLFIQCWSFVGSLLLLLQRYFIFVLKPELSLLVWPFKLCFVQHKSFLHLHVFPNFLWDRFWVFPQSNMISFSQSLSHSIAYWITFRLRYNSLLLSRYIFIIRL